MKSEIQQYSKCNHMGLATESMFTNVETTVTYKKSHFLLKSVQLYLVEKSNQKALYFPRLYGGVVRQIKQ